MRYHDEEWGVPVYDDHKLFEMLILESFQAGSISGFITISLYILSGAEKPSKSIQVSRTSLVNISIFDIDRFTSFEGDTGPYILYTIVRIKSI